MDGQEVAALAVFASYFVAIAVVAGLVVRSLWPAGQQLLNPRPSLFLRVAVAALLCTWYYMFHYFRWSYSAFARFHPSPSIPQWLVQTSLFDQAWETVCRGEASWWWSSWICTWAVVFTAVVWQQSAARGIRYPLAYVVLGQFVAMSLATSLFLAAVYAHPVRSSSARASRSAPLALYAPFALYAPLGLALAAVRELPALVGTARFLPGLVAVHLLVAVPLFFVPVTSTASTPSDRPSTPLAIPFRLLYPLLAASAACIHLPLTLRIAATPAPLKHLIAHVFSHPAQASVSLDVVWVVVNLVLWAVVSGSTAGIIAKSAALAVTAALGAARCLGVHWGFIASVVPIVLLLGFGGVAYLVAKVTGRNDAKRAALMDRLGIKDGGVVQGDRGRPPSVSKRQTVVGFWHPYCNAGGGGERVLWSAIAYLQRQPDVVALVYTGDYSAASKEEIIDKVKDRFSITLEPSRLHFVPLKSRHLIADDYWPHLTLLGQSIGSLWLAWEGLCGRDGLIGDVFIDSMGYAFTLPFVRLVAGPDVRLGAYVHYPTVSADMVRRVRAREAGVESGGVASGRAKTLAKLVYYRVFTSLYATALLFSQHTMTNSSWTQAHVESLIAAGKQSALATILLLDDLSVRKRRERGEPVRERTCEVVFPPCDTDALVGSTLEGRTREIVSLAQFRPEKDHAKQIHALALLFERHPELRDGAEKVTLTLMGGSRNEADEARLDGLRRLAKELGVEANTAFLVNAPYHEVVVRLRAASIGLNTMIDEHFGISCVEFMAAGLIPIVHASAGPKLDIVTPYESQQTGFHATDAASFAEAMHTALAMSPAEQLSMRRAARGAAVERFGQRRFEQGFGRAWRQHLA
ncbi:asparagine-linked glycosylation protein [Cryptotrichosporon argae]